MLQGFSELWNLVGILFEHKLKNRDPNREKLEEGRQKEGEVRHEQSLTMSDWGFRV